MTLRYSFLYLVLTMMFGSVQAQVAAPDLLCLKNDTLIWNTPTNSCGAFVAYNIYSSTSPTGPFSLLTSINDASQTTFFDANPSNEIRYYYMQSNNNCPGQTILSSDTLDNLVPVLTPITSVSVINNEIVIDWEENPSPEVVAYIIYRNELIGTTPIDTIFGTSIYTDNSIAPDAESKEYLILALDPCGNTSLFDLPHSNMLLGITQSECEQTMSLTWNAYQNWVGGIGRQEVWLGINGDTPVPIDTIDANATTYLYENVQDSTDYCFSIKAINSTEAYFAFSNEVCLAADIVRPMTRLDLINVSLDAANKITLTWAQDTAAEIAFFDIAKSQNGTIYQFDSYPAVLPLSSDVTYLDSSQFLKQSIYYQITSKDACGTAFNSNIAASIYLEGTSPNAFYNDLTWTAYDNPLGAVTKYYLYRTVSGVSQLAANIDPSSPSSFQDPVNVASPSESNVCYYILAEADVTLTDGTVLKNVPSRSNTVCVSQTVGIITPNAFAPYGENPIFKPLLRFPLEIKTYSMQIFDRYGGMIFESTNPQTGWDGRINSRDAAPGIYTYYIYITQLNGNIARDTGTVMLVK